MSDAVIDMQGITKVFYTDEVETHALAEVNLHDRARRVRVDLRTVGLRQVHAAVDLGLLDTPTGGKYLLNGRQVET